MVQAFIAGLIYIGLPLVVKILTGLGIGMITYTGADFALTEAESYILANYNAMPVDALAIMNKAGILQGLNIFFAAWAASIAIQVATGAFTKLKVSPQ